MQVVVLAGGVGSRLRPWSNSIPKPLLPVLAAEDSLEELMGPEQQRRGMRMGAAAPSGPGPRK